MGPSSIGSCPWILCMYLIDLREQRRGEDEPARVHELREGAHDGGGPRHLQG